MVGFSPSYQQQFLCRFTVTLDRITAIICHKILLDVCLHCMHCKHSWQMLSVSLCEHNFGTNGSSYYEHQRNQTKTSSQWEHETTVSMTIKNVFELSDCTFYHEASHNFILTWKVYMCKLVCCQEWNWFTMLKVGLNTEPVIREL